MLKKLTWPALLLLLHVQPAAASNEISVTVYPRVFSSPQQSIDINYSISSGACPYEGVGGPLWLDYVEVDGSDNFYSDGDSVDGTFFDSITKPKEDLGYDVWAHVYCSNIDGDPDFNFDFWLSGGAGVALRPIIDSVAQESPSVEPTKYSMPGAYCSMTGENDGFTYNPWYELFDVYDAWGDPYDGDFDTYENISTEQIEACDFPPYSPGWVPQSYGFFVDSHIVVHQNCCNVSSCDAQSDASWTGRGNGAQMWLLDQGWVDGCFAHNISYLVMR